MAEVQTRFAELIKIITDRIAGEPVVPDLANILNTEFPSEGPVFREIEALCHQGCEEGWLFTGKHERVRFGRPIEAGPLTSGFSVDVVEMEDKIGPHHIHPNGEIDMIMPIGSPALFDGTGRGWMVYESGSAHRPTVSDGKAFVLYLLPNGAIDFTGE